MNRDSESSTGDLVQWFPINQEYVYNSAGSAWKDLILLCYYTYKSLLHAGLSLILIYKTVLLVGVQYLLILELNHIKDSKSLLLNISSGSVYKYIFLGEKNLHDFRQNSKNLWKTHAQVLC